MFLFCLPLDVTHRFEVLRERRAYTAREQALVEDVVQEKIHAPFAHTF